MRKMVLGVFVVVALAGIAAQAQAMTAGSFHIIWTDIQGFRYNWSTTNDANYDQLNVSANNGLATATFDPTGIDPLENLGAVWCVDLFNHTGYNSTFAVTQWVDTDTGVDPNNSAYAWLNPVGDGDDLRSAAGLGQAAYLANHYGSAVNTLGDKLALQMAIWTAAYGTNRFQWVVGTGGVNTAKYNEFYGYITTGMTDVTHEWYDNNDPGDQWQDFMNDVPEPSSVLLLGGALLSAALGWRKRRQA